MPTTYAYTVDAVGDDEPVIAQSDCEEITVFEAQQAATSGFTVRSPFRTSSAVTLPAGSPFTFRAGSSGFIKGRTVGYVAATSGSFTMCQVEK